MKVPSIRAKIGSQHYYVATLTFEQIAKYVSPIDEQLHSSKTLSDLIQRSITDNYKSIKDYILNQKDMFFSSLVLAVYDDYPEWQQVSLKFDSEEYHQIGFLNFPAQHKIFPVDGQHRVEGIKKAIEENPDVKENEISVIFIGHDNKNKHKTRRIFTTLNRYSKPVSLRDVIALDEDDTVAIITRSLLEGFDLFENGRVVDTKGKAIPSNNNVAITSIITLYQANLEIAKSIFKSKYDRKPTKKVFNDSFLRFRPSNEEIEYFEVEINNFWEMFKNNLTFIKDYSEQDTISTNDLRTKETGGNLLFRPVGLLPFIQAVFLINERSKKNINTILKEFNSLDYSINKKPWINVVWNDIEKKMIMSSSTITKLLLIYQFNKALLKEKELIKLYESYAAKNNITEKESQVELEAI